MAVSDLDLSTPDILHGVSGKSLWLTLEGVSCVCSLAADAGKHWNGLIKGYFAERVSRIMAAGLSAAAAGKPLPASTINAIKGQLDKDFSTTFNVSYPSQPVGDAVELSQQMHEKYAPRFAQCAAPDSQQAR